MADIGLVNNASGIGTTSLSFTCSGNSRLLLVLISGGTPASVSYGGAPLTIIRTAYSNVSMWYLENAPLGTANITIASSMNIFAICLSNALGGIVSSNDMSASGTNAQVANPAGSGAIANDWLFSINTGNYGYLEWNTGTLLMYSGGSINVGYRIQTTGAETTSVGGDDTKRGQWVVIRPASKDSNGDSASIMNEIGVSI